MCFIVFLPSNHLKIRSQKCNQHRLARTGSEAKQRGDYAENFGGSRPASFRQRRHGEHPQQLLERLRQLISAFFHAFSILRQEASCKTYKMGGNSLPCTYHYLVSEFNVCALIPQPETIQQRHAVPHSNIFNIRLLCASIVLMPQRPHDCIP